MLAIIDHHLCHRYHNSSKREREGTEVPEVSFWKPEESLERFLSVNQKSILMISKNTPPPFANPY